MKNLLDRVKNLFARVARADVARNSMLVLAAIMLGNIFNYVYYLLMGRALAPREYGAVMSLVSAALLVIGMGNICQTAVAKLAADLRAAGDEERMAGFAHAIVRLALLAAAGIFVIAIVLRKPLTDYLHLVRPEFVGITGLAAAVGLAVLFQRGLFQGFGVFKSFAVSSALDGAKAIFILPLAHFFGALGALIAFLCGSTVSLLYGWAALRRRMRGVDRAPLLDVRRLLRSAGATGIASLSIIVLMFYDVVLAKHYITASEAGLYSAAALAGRIILAACSFLPIILLPDITLRSATGRPHRHVLAATIAIAAAIAGAVAIACALAPRFVLGILAGKAFAGAAPLLFPYVLSSGALAIGNLLATYSIARHRFGFIPFVLLIAIAEIASVTLRHATPMAIVQDILAGHSLICLAMAAWVAFDLSRAPAVHPGAPQASA